MGGKTQASDGQGGYTDLTTVSRAYNGFDEMDSETQYGSRTFTFTHDAMGAVKKITFPSGGPVMEVEYVYDAAGRVDKVKRKLSADVEGVGTPALATSATFEYAGHREIERVQSPYDLTRTQSWSTWREPVVLKYEESSTGTLLTGLHSYWDDDGRMVVRERTHDDDGTAWGEVFRYDEMDRLVTMWRNVAGPSSFTSTDPVDATDTFDDKMDYVLGKVYERDKTKVTPDSGSTTTTEYTNNDFYQYTDVGGTTHTWDENGQLTDNGDWAFSWTALGQLAKATPDTGTAQEYLYDAFGRRVETKVGSAVSKYIYVDWHMVGEHDGTDWLWQEVPLTGEGMLEHVALDTNDLDGDQDTDEYRGYAVHEDFQHTVWGLSDTAGAIVERYRYREPYGDNYAEDGQGNGLGDFASNVYQAKRLHGGVIDGKVALYDFRNRWLMSATGFWLSRDPAGDVDSANLYQAFLSTPLEVTDLFGETCWFLAKLLVGVRGDYCGGEAQALAEVRKQWHQYGEAAWGGSWMTCIEYCKSKLEVEFKTDTQASADSSYSGMSIVPICGKRPNTRPGYSTVPVQAPPGAKKDRKLGALARRFGLGIPGIYYNTAGHKNGIPGSHVLSHEMKHWFENRHQEGVNPNPGDLQACDLATETWVANNNQWRLPECLCHRCAPCNSNTDIRFTAYLKLSTMTHEWLTKQ